MKILYVTNLWSGVRPLLFDGVEHETGMPAFLEPLKCLAGRGHELTIIFASKDSPPPLSISLPWLRRIHIRFVHTSAGGRKLRRALSQEVRSQLDFSAFDFLYLQGEKASELWKEARRRRLPCGQRIYGVDDTWRRFRGRPPLFLQWRKPRLVASFSGMKSFVIVTRDGSFGDRVQKMIERDPAYSFHHVLNGVKKRERAIPDLSELLETNPYLFCPARFAEMKTKENDLYFLRRLHDEGYPQVRLKVAGQISSRKSYERFLSVMSELQLEDSVDFLGAIGREEVASYHREALGVLSLYAFSNLSNVAIEALAAGACLVSIDDGSLEGICDRKSAILGHGVNEAADRFLILMRSPDVYNRQRQEAWDCAQIVFREWEERAAWEADLIEEAVRVYPSVPGG